MKDDFRKIGKIKGSHGIRGEVFILIFSKDTSWVESKLQIHLSSNGLQFKSYTVEKFKEHKDGIIAVLAGLNSRNDSDLLIGQEVWVSSDFFNSKDGDPLYLVEIENFEVIDEKLKTIGHIKGFSTNGIQDLLIVSGKSGEFEIPFVDEFIREISYTEKVIKTDLPEGLLDINKNDEN